MAAMQYEEAPGATEPNATRRSARVRVELCLGSAHARLSERLVRTRRAKINHGVLRGTMCWLRAALVLC